MNRLAAALVADFGIALAVTRSDGRTRLTETGMPPSDATGPRRPDRHVTPSTLPTRE